jgi:hypothetical protein
LRYAPAQEQMLRIHLTRRVYLIIDKQMNILYRKDTGFALLPNQTETLIGKIDRKIQ